MREFVVTKKEAGSRFDKYLKRMLPSASSGFVYKMLRKKNITLNDRKAEGKELLAEKDVVKLFFSEETFLKFSGKYEAQNPDGEYRRAFRELGEVPVVYEDEDILILNKPAGVLSQKAKKDDISLNEWMIGYLAGKGEITEEELLRFRPSVCNRLDRNTSGILLCGKTLRGSRFLAQVLRDRSLHKYYFAYVKGRIEHPIELNGYLKKDEEKNRAEIIPEEEYQEQRQNEYQKVETVIMPLSYFAKADCTKLEILLVTGKSHQIRAHLANIGHPVLGDVKYGWKREQTNGGLPEDMDLTYQLLHAYRVEFPEIEGDFSYLSGKNVTAPLPELFQKLEGNLLT